MAALPSAQAHRGQPPLNFLALVCGASSGGGVSSLAWYIHANTSYPSLFIIFPSSATAVLVFLLYLVWSIAFSMFLGVILVRCLHHLLESLPGCDIMYPRRMLSKRSILHYSTLCPALLDGPPSGSGRVPSSLVLLHVGLVLKPLCGVVSFLPTRQEGQILSHFSTSLPDCKEHLLFMITQMGYVRLQPYYWMEGEVRVNLKGGMYRFAGERTLHLLQARGEC